MTQLDVAPDGRTWRKPEGVWGNILEFILTWGAGLCLYLPINAVLVFTDWFIPESAEGRADFWEVWHFCNLIYLLSQIIASNIGAQARFAGRSLRLFGDGGASISPLTIPMFVFVLGMMNAYDANEIQQKIAIFVSMTVLIDIGNSLMQNISTQRVEEVNKGR